jgi:hypothetical protein
MKYLLLTSVIATFLLSGCASGTTPPAPVSLSGNTQSSISITTSQNDQ